MARKEETLSERLDRISDIVVLLKELEEKIDDPTEKSAIATMRLDYEIRQENAEDAYFSSPEYREFHPDAPYFYIMHNAEVW